MDVNYEVWGTPDTWVDGEKAQLKADIKFAASTNDTLGEAWTTGRVPWNTVDLSAAYWGISKNSMWAHPHQVWAWSEDGQTSDFEVGEGELLTQAVDIPAIFTTASNDVSCPVSYTRRWKYRGATEQKSISGNAYIKRVFMDFNYQKVIIAPYVICKPADWEVTHVVGDIKQTDNISFVDYFDNDGYINRPQILGFGYRCYFGDGDTQREQTASFGLVDLLIDAPGHSGYTPNIYFAGPDGASFATHNITGWSVIPQDITVFNRQGDGTVGDSDTGFRWVYSPDATGGSGVRFYYYDDNPLWEINKTVFVYNNHDYWGAYPRILCTATNKDAAKAYAMKQIAYLGLPFVIDPETAKTGKIGDIGVYLPKFDDDGITTGEYAEGTAALTLPNAQWVDGRTGSGYDPTKPTPGEDTGDDGVEVRPSNPAFTLAGRGTQCYAITPADMTEIFTDIYGRSKGSFQDLTEGLALFGADPMGAIISYKWYPFNFEPNTNASIVLGTTEINPSHTYPIIQNVLSSMKNFKGTFRLNADKDFINSRATQARLYLPFYGFYELPMPQLISHELEIEFHYNAPDEVGTWIISWNNVIYDFVECDPAIEIPLTGTNARVIRQAKVGAALNIAATVAQTAATVGMGIASFNAGIGAAAGAASSEAGIATFGKQGAMEWGAQIGRATTTATNYSTAAGIVGALANGYNGISNAVASVNRLKVNVPFHPASDATTFLNLSMVPYLQLYTNQPIVDYSGNSEAPRQYMLKVGIACDKWVTTSSMPDESLLKTTGIANMDINGMELSEVQELNGILQSGFYK